MRSGRAQTACRNLEQRSDSNRIDSILKQASWTGPFGFEASGVAISALTALQSTLPCHGVRPALGSRSGRARVALGGFRSAYAFFRPALAPRSPSAQIALKSRLMDFDKRSPCGFSNCARPALAPRSNCAQIALSRINDLPSFNYPLLGSRAGRARVALVWRSDRARPFDLLRLPGFASDQWPGTPFQKARSICPARVLEANALNRVLPVCLWDDLPSRAQTALKSRSVRAQNALA